MNLSEGFRPLLAVFFALIAYLVGCGGGDDGGGQAPPPEVVYVRQSGSDTNTGASPDEALRTIAQAVQGAFPGQTIIVGPGEYRVPPEIGSSIAIEDLDGSEPFTLLADPEGEMTDDANRPGPVTILGNNSSGFGIRVSRARNVIIDGFRIELSRSDGESAAIQVRSDSADIVIQNCEISLNRDAIRVESSSDVLIFNNLIYDNNRGIRLRATSSVDVLHNTITDNAARGISMAGDAVNTMVRNNILQDNSNRNIEIERGDAIGTYDGDFNLVYSTRNNVDPEDTVAPSTILGDDAVLGDALFVDPRPTRADYRLMPESPAIDAGDGTIDGLLLSVLFSRTTTEDGASDAPPIDLGYHFP